MAIKINVMPDLIYKKEVVKILEKCDVRYNKPYHEDPDAILAGMEIYDKEMLNSNLKCISRMGSGIDNIDINECDKREIKILTTKEECANAVAELAIWGAYTALRIPSHKDMLGRELKHMVVGVIGDGHIGSIVQHKMHSLCAKTYYSDIKYNGMVGKPKNYILETCDIITLHIPLRDRGINNYDFIKAKDLARMKKNAIIINTSRGGIVNEKDLYKWLLKNEEAAAVLDVFENEPYKGELLSLPNVIATNHIGSMTVNARKGIEIGAAENIIRELKVK